MRFKHEVAEAFASLTIEDLRCFGVQSMQPALRRFSLPLASWLTNSCRGEHDRRQGHDYDPATIPSIDEWTDEDVADATQAAIVLHNSTVSETAGNFATALLYWVTAHLVVRTKARTVVMSN